MQYVFFHGRFDHLAFQYLEVLYVRHFDNQKTRHQISEKKSAKLQIRSPKHWPIGFFAGLSYINMVAAWGGVLVWMDLLWPGMAREQGGYMDLPEKGQVFRHGEVESKK